MHALPDIPYELGMIEKILKVRKDYQVRVHNRRFSVPYTYAGKEVKVRLWTQKNLLVVYDLRNGKEIARHHYDGMGNDPQKSSRRAASVIGYSSHIDARARRFMMVKGAPVGSRFPCLPNPDAAENPDPVRTPVHAGFTA